jgi:SAM-dependent methyltransferase
MTSGTVDLYNHAYGDFGGAAEEAVRRETYGEDLGQTSWLTAPEWLRFADQAGITADSDVLEVGSGSGGPGVYLARERGCRLTGVDINEHGVRNANALAKARGLGDRVQFQTVDASEALPFPAGRFDAVLCNDAICHIRHRETVLREWHRVLRPGGRALFTDALVITGVVSHEEIANRSSIGFYLFVPPGENERLLGAAGFSLLGVEDVTQAAADIARRRHDARERHRAALVAREGDANFDGLQRFLMGVHTLSAERRLSRFAYLAEKPRA